MRLIQLLSTRQLLLLGLTATTTLSLATPTAQAQDALGDGQALDSNLGVGTGGRNSATGQRDYRLQNLLITGDVAGGRQFRGAVGYAASRDFRAPTGSDDLFRFQADSAFSSLATLSNNYGIRGNQPYGLGQQFGLLEYRQESVGATFDTVLENQQQRDDQYADYLETQFKLDTLTISQATESGLLRGASMPDTLAVLRKPDGVPVRLTASALRGVQAVESGRDFNAVGLSLYDQARVMDDQIMGDGSPLQIGQPHQTSFNDFRIDDGRITNDAIQGDDQPLVSAEYDSILVNVADRFANAESEQTDERIGRPLGQRLDEEMTALKDWMNKQATASQTTLGSTEEDDYLSDVPGAGDLEQPTGGTTLRPFDPDSLRPDLGNRDDDDENANETDEDRDSRQLGGSVQEILADGTTIEMLRHGHEITTFAPDGSDRFAEVMQSAEAQLRSEEYFKAEREFVRALRFKRDHPLAMAGLANTQLGAQVYASAALSLRNLMVKNPEMIDVRYAPGLLPEEVRLRRDAEVLTQRISEGRRSAGSALLVAYIGHQLDDHQLTDDGLRLMAKMDSRDPLVPILRGVWLDENVNLDDPVIDRSMDDATIPEPDK